MASLTPHEQQHVDSVEEIRISPRLHAECGDPAFLARTTATSVRVAHTEGSSTAVPLSRELLDHSPRLTDTGALWRTKGKRLPRVYGDFNLLHLDDVLSQQDDRSTHPENSTDFQHHFLSQLRCFDHTPRSGSGKLAYLRFEPDSGQHEIWYSAIADLEQPPYPPGFIKLDITFPRYLDALALTKGTYGWQYLYADISLARGDFHEVAGYLQGMVDVFPELFPGRDYSELRERLAARR